MVGELDILQIAAQYGPGLLVAFVLLIWKRADDKKYADTLQSNGTMLRELNERCLEAMRANTQALGELRAVLDTDAMLERLERKLNQRGAA